MVWDLDTIVRQNDAVCESVATEEQKPLVEIGDWITFGGSSPKRVIGRSRGGVKYYGDNGDGYLRHGMYTVVKQSILPWTFDQACVALASNGMTIHSAFAYRVVGVGVDGVTIETGGHRDHFTYRDLAGTFVLSNGEPCGAVEWKPVGASS